MEAKELRIGLWMKSTIMDLNYFQLKLKDIVNEFESNYNGLFEPIPLTEEWLFKFGFKKCKNGWYYTTYFTDCDLASEIMKIDYNLSSGRFSITDADEESTSCQIYTSKRVKHVHQLQNLYFTLTGEEL